MPLAPRPIVYLGVAALAGVLAIAATATPLFRHEPPAQTVGSTTLEVRSESTLWRTCYEMKVTGRPTNRQCRDVDEFENNCGILDRYRAMRAFCILTILVCFLAAVPLGVVDLVNLAALPSNLRKIAMAAAGGIVAVFSLIMWAIWADTWHYECNGNASLSSQVEGKWGPSAPLMIVVTVFGVVLAIVAMVAPGAREDANAAADHEAPAVVMTGPADDNEGARSYSTVDKAAGASQQDHDQRHHELTIAASDEV